MRKINTIRINQQKNKFNTIIERGNTITNKGNSPMINLNLHLISKHRMAN